MKRIIFFIFSMLVCLSTLAQELKVKSFSLASNDLSASVNDVKDLNGEACALVKINIPTEILAVEGNVIGNVQKKGSEKWVYITAGTKEVKIHSSNNSALLVRFPNFGITGVQGKRVYLLDIVENDKVKMQKLVIDYLPTDATILVDSRLIPGNGHAEVDLPVGEHAYIAAKSGYYSTEGKIKVQEHAPTNIRLQLNKEKEQSGSQDQVVVEGEVDTLDFKLSYLRAEHLFENKQYNQALLLFKKSAEMGYAKAQYKLGYCYQNGYGVYADTNAALKWYTQAANQNEPLAMTTLGIWYIEGHGVSKNNPKGFLLLRKATELGCPAAYVAMGSCYEYGLGIRKNKAVAFTWYHKAAESGDVNGFYNLGRCYISGIGCDKNKAFAKIWLVQAVENNSKEAKQLLERQFK